MTWVSSVGFDETGQLIKIAANGTYTNATAIDHWGISGVPIKGEYVTTLTGAKPAAFLSPAIAAREDHFWRLPWLTLD